MSDPVLPSRPPEEGVRLLALGFLGQATDAAPRLADEEDGEALHDFRVGLRRLRSALRSYREILADSVPRKLARRLRRLAAATGQGRDTEVQIEWLRRVAPSRLASHRRAGWHWLLQRLEARKREAYAAILQDVDETLAPLAEELRQRLSVYRLEVHLDAAVSPSSLGKTTAEIAERQLQELERRLDGIAGPEDEAVAHEARIEAKRLRYLLEPFAEDKPIRQAVKGIKALQDLLGELHDAHVLELELGSALAAAAVEQAERLLDASLAEPYDPSRLRVERRRSPVPGLLALARLNRERRNALFAALGRDWLGGKAAPFLAEVAAAAASLRGE